MYSSTLKATITKIHFYLSFINLVKSTFLSWKHFFVNKQIIYFFPLKRFLNLIKFMLINFKLINFMLTNFVNKQISYFFSLKCFLDMIKFMLINFKLINFMSMNFVNKQINFFHLDVF